MASLWAAVMSEGQQEVEDAKLARDRTRYKDARDDYRRCQALGIQGRGYHTVAKDNGIPPIWLSIFNKEEYHEGLDSIDANDDSSNEESSTGDF